jgi:hypothetical protein
MSTNPTGRRTSPAEDPQLDQMLRSMSKLVTQLTDNMDIESLDLGGGRTQDTQVLGFSTFGSLGSAGTVTGTACCACTFGSAGIKSPESLE